VKKLLDILSLIYIARAAVVVDRLNIDVGEKSISVDSVWVTEGRTVFSCFAVRTKV
jgi:hypothetical protein